MNWTVEICPNAVVICLRAQFSLDIFLYGTNDGSVRNLDVPNRDIRTFLLMTLEDLCLTA